MQKQSDHHAIKDDSMHSCCSVPLEKIAANQHRTDEACCLVTEQTAAPAYATCPSSGEKSRRVQHRTVEHLVKPEKRTDIENVQYYYCTDPSCDVVYFSNQKAPAFGKQDLLVRVFAKDPGEDVNVCYCYDWTRGRIKTEIEATGKSTAAGEIAKEVKAGRCLCDVKNPKGECCLGDVTAVVRDYKAAAG